MAVGESYRPVLLMHGLFASPETMEVMKKMITAAHPGTPVHNIDAYNDGVRPLTESTLSILYQHT